MKIKWEKQRDKSYFGVDEDGNTYKKTANLETVTCFLAPTHNYYGQAWDEDTALKRALKAKEKWESI